MAFLNKFARPPPRESPPENALALPAPQEDWYKDTDLDMNISEILIRSKENVFPTLVGTENKKVETTDSSVQANDAAPSCKCDLLLKTISTLSETMIVSLYKMESRLQAIEEKIEVSTPHTHTHLCAHLHNLHIILYYFAIFNYRDSQFNHFYSIIPTLLYPHSHQ